MSVPNQTPYIIYNANGLTTVFPFEFYVISASDIQVTFDGVEVTTGYSVSGVGNVSGGDVVFVTPPAAGTVVMIERVVPTYRLTDYQDNGDLLADTVNKDFDRLWMAIQRSFIYLGLALRRPLFGGPFDAEGYRISHGADPVDKQDFVTKNYVDNVSLVRALRVPEPSIPALPSSSLRANKLLAFNAAGNPITVLPQSGSASDVLIELAKPTGAGLVGATDQDGDPSTVQEELDNISSHFSQTPKDYFVGSFFASNSDNALTLFRSFNGHDFTKLNQSQLVSEDSNTIGNRDPSITYYKGNWYVSATTGGTSGAGSTDADFLIFKSSDLISWKLYKCLAGPTLLKGQPGSVIGGTIPTISPIWAPSLLVKDNELWVQLSIGYKPQAPDVNGTMVNWCAPFACKCNNLNTLTFDFPQLMMSDTSVQRIDVEISINPLGGYVLVIKNEYNKHVEVWTSLSYIGGYSKIADLDFGGVAVEGPSLVWVNSQSIWRLYADAFSANGTTYYTESADLVVWTVPQIVQSPWPLRHGTVLNLANLPDAKKAINSFMLANGLMSSDIVVPCWAEGGTIAAGAQTIVPKCNYVYRVGGTLQATVTINERGGDWFYLLVASGQPVAGITINGTAVDGAFSIGFGQSNQRIFKVWFNPVTGFYELEGMPNAKSDSAGFSSQAGWPNINTSFIPVYGRTYTTSGSDSSNTIISNLTSQLPDGSFFHIWVGSDTSNGSVTIRASGSNIQIGSSDVTLSGASGSGNRLYTMKKVGGLWRLAA
ncbi:phage tail fiber protein [Citrobacter koseri]|uniref:phage tail fiber domain-containing protein n=1 Tax=Citrobacter koseri TaxID=545 RepID=UPI0029423BD9|nr:phage tail fiber protein [Citrobacter koseri]WOJ32704.1 phage tail fiber protein [Citrobacter koseri]WOJ36877.1 phage tail fiber protein [Citrobacter koseri]